ncbi:MAG: hypothetical protein L0K07_12135 [Yaniella sp.]|nr:hypothetical protein [Yaniella sp.]
MKIYQGFKAVFMLSWRLQRQRSLGLEQLQALRVHGVPESTLNCPDGSMGLKRRLNFCGAEADPIHRIIFA